MFRFRELLRCSGVDEEATPPGIMVPLGGSNVVLLDTDGADVEVGARSRAIRVKEIDGAEIRKKLIETNIAVNQPGIDSAFRDAMLPTSMFWYYKPRIFEIRSHKLPVSFPGAEVWAKQKGRGAETKLKVVVLEEKKVKVAIHNVLVTGPDGKSALHSKQRCDPQQEVKNMNAVWNPQANVSFELVSSTDVIVDLRDQAIRSKLGRALGLSDPGGAVIAPNIQPGKLGGFFKELAPSAAAISFFYVGALAGGSSGTATPSGVFVSESQKGMTTFAHEAGHFLRNKASNGAWTNKGHTYNKNSDQDVRELMRDGGAGWKVTWRMVKECRQFFAIR
jgi:hypothetical protein